MTQKDKELLLKDLCARLPYGTLVYAQNADDWYDDEISTQVLSDVINEDYVVKPYLFPLSSMTEEQKKEESSFNPFKTEEVKTLGDWAIRLVEFYNKHHFDYHGLIEKGLALDASGLNIY